MRCKPVLLSIVKYPQDNKYSNKRDAHAVSHACKQIKGHSPVELESLNWMNELPHTQHLITTTSI